MKMEIELTDEQAKKVESLKKNDIGVGDAIDMLFEMNNVIVDNRIDAATQQKAELEKKLAEVDEEISLFTKLKDSSLDSTQKQKIVEKEYISIDETYDKSVLNTKHKFKWSKAIF